jgi:hypothetical protein
MADPTKPTIDDLIAWGLDYEELLKEPRAPGAGFTVPRPMLDQYIAAANAALVQQREQARKKAKKPGSRGGRPRGGMGEQKLRLLEAGVPDEDTDRITARSFGKPPEAVQRACDRILSPQKTPAKKAGAKTGKKPPP